MRGKNEKLAIGKIMSNLNFISVEDKAYSANLELFYFKNTL